MTPTTVSTYRAGLHSRTSLHIGQNAFWVYNGAMNDLKHVTSFVVQAEGYERKTLEWVVLARDLRPRTSDETRKHRTPLVKPAAASLIKDQPLHT